MQERINGPSTQASPLIGPVSGHTRRSSHIWAPAPPTPGFLRRKHAHEVSLGTPRGPSPACAGGIGLYVTHIVRSALKRGGRCGTGPLRLACRSPVMDVGHMEPCRPAKGQGDRQARSPALPGMTARRRSAPVARACPLPPPRVGASHRGLGADTSRRAGDGPVGPTIRG